MSNAINLYLRQIVLRRGLPFEVLLPPRKPQALMALSGEQIDAELKKGIEDVKSGRVSKASDVHARLKEKYGI
jgi:antitoxin component of RelBE/YafQ-DinJ toxin-antitoxin module